MHILKSKTFYGVAVVFVAAILQATALNYIVVLGVKPDILLICVIFLSLIHI